MTYCQEACKKVSGFKEVYTLLERHLILNGRSSSTLENYTRCISRLSLHFNESPLKLSIQQIEDYLLILKNYQHSSPSYFKHTVYGLRYLYKITGDKDKYIKLPSIPKKKKLPTVLSKQECKLLFKTPKLLKHRIILCIIYSAGLRVSEVANLEQKDIDFQRKTIHIKDSKYNKDRYIPLSNYIIKGLKAYYNEYKPQKWVFNGQTKNIPLSASRIQSIVKEIREKSGIQKEITTHTLRHSYATHLLEDGVDLVTIQKLLGHAKIETTMIYLHIVFIDHKKAKSPLDTLYGY